MDLAHERAVNAALIAALSGREPHVPTLETQMNDADLQALTRRSPLLSQVKRRAMDVLERERKEREAKGA
jgi:hypothetical protein